MVDTSTTETSERLLLAALDRYMRQDETAADTDNGVYRQAAKAMKAYFASQPVTQSVEPVYRIVVDTTSGLGGPCLVGVYKGDLCVKNNIYYREAEAWIEAKTKKGVSRG